MITKTDCFAFDENKCDCKVLNKLYCQKEKCSFYKTKTQVEKERKKYGGVK